jgi:glutathione S-transferase
VLIALWADETPFEYRMLDPDHPDNGAELTERWPFGKFPLLVDDGVSVIETDADHRASSCPASWEGRLDSRWRRRTKNPLPRPFLRHLRNDQHAEGRAGYPSPEGSRDPYGVEQARAELRLAYDWLELNLGDGPWAIGDRFSLADCAAAPSLFYADWLVEIGPERPRLAAYRAPPSLPSSGSPARSTRAAPIATSFQWARRIAISCIGGLCLEDFSMRARLLLALSVLPLASSTAAKPVGETAVLAGGCFWGMEAVFEHV